MSNLAMVLNSAAPGALNGERVERCACGALFAFYRRSKGRPGRRCPDCRAADRRFGRPCGSVVRVAPDGERCCDCAALVGLEWGTIERLEASGRCPACEAWALRNAPPEMIAPARIPPAVAEWAAERLARREGYAGWADVRSNRQDPDREAVRGAVLLALYEAGWPPSAIGQVLGRHERSVWHQLHRGIATRQDPDVPFLMAAFRALVVAGTTAVAR